jgi:uroporphyrin-3 C-methyltransferase
MNKHETTSNASHEVHGASSSVKDSPSEQVHASPKETVGSPSQARAHSPHGAAALTKNRLGFKDKLVQGLMWVVGLCSLLAVVLGFYLWEKLSHVQELLARQSADASQVSLEAKSLAKESMDASRDTAAKLALTQNKLSEVILQRAQMDALMQSLSRSRDENLVEDIDASLRLSQQQALLTGSLQPLLSALKTADERLAKLSQPRLASLQRAIAKDMDRVKSFSMADTPNLLIQFDETMRLVDELPLINDVLRPKDKALGFKGGLSTNGEGHSSTAVQQDSASVAPQPSSALMNGANAVNAVNAKTEPQAKVSWAQGIAQGWWQKAFDLVWQEFKGLVRVSQIDQPQGVLLSPEQAFFVRENLKLRLLNARMALLARQMETAKADAGMVQSEINKYFDVRQKNTAVALSLLQNIQVNLKQLQLPSLNESFSAIAQAQAQAGR